MSVQPAYQTTNELLICANIDNSIRWQPDKRLDHLFEERCDLLSDTPNHLAVISDNINLTYAELDKHANQLARYLIKQGIGSNDRVGLLYNKSAYTYIALLAVLKINAAYVPLDASFPNDRISYIADDANIKAILTLSIYEDKLSELNLPIISTDNNRASIDTESTDRLTDTEKQKPLSELCYIIYTSGTTGHPKGVAIDHPSICNFVSVASEVYGLKQEDRMYQGLTIAFDFSVEEIWVSLIVGATLVPGKPDTNLVGEDLAEFLIEKNITALCCVPTLLASIDRDVPNLRYLLVSGEACPHDLVNRWYRPDRRFINAYGPTEATVTATITTLHPDKPVTIGGPLPTYTIVILDADDDFIIEKGDVGEICIAGIGLAEGYLNRPDLTEKAFIPDFIGIDNNPSNRIYRTGDLGRINSDDEIEYLGRIDTQVKIRGYRIELTEIESVLLQTPQIAQAVVDTYEQLPGTVELVAYYSLKQGESDIPHDQLQEELKKHLPNYMIPVFYEKMASIPMTSSHKADRKNLPAPTGTRAKSSSNLHVPPETEMETYIASALSDILNIDDISIDDDFFNDLGAHSLLMAQLSTKIRKHESQPDVSMREIYLNPTIRQLAETVQSTPSKIREENQPYRKPSTFSYFTCGSFQLIYYFSLFFLYLTIGVKGIIWIFSDPSIISIYQRGLGFSILMLLLFSAIPIAMKWLLIGKWKKERIPVWSFKYFRFWVVKHLIQTSPMALFKGLPFYNIYLRLLGAKIGKDVVINSLRMPICTDLIEIGDGTILRKDSIIPCYKAQSGYIETGPISIGENCFIGEASFIDIDVTMENNTQLGHASSLQSGQHILTGKNYHGSPAVETTTNYCTVATKNCSTFRRYCYSVLVTSPIPIILPVILAALHFFYPELLAYISSHLSSQDLSTISKKTRDVLHIYSEQHNPLMVLTILFFISGIIFSVLLVLRFLSIILLPRLANLFIRENRTYVLYGIHYYIFRLISRTSNSYFFNLLFGDSSYILFYLNAVGFKASKVEQSGSNFGQSQKHDSPFLCATGAGTMVSDGLSMINAEISSNSFRLRRATIGDSCFLGNNIHYPAGATLGNNCLMATKTLIPINTAIKENTGLLGSPAFEIPRSSDDNQSIETYDEPGIRSDRIKKKNIYNLYTIVSFLFFHWVFLFSTLIYGYITVYSFTHWGVAALLIALLLFPTLSIAYFIFVEKLSLNFKRMEPRTCSIYDSNFWKVEHYWKHAHAPIMGLYKGTPFKNIITRLLGVKLGKKVFDDGAFATEKTMVTIGDYCTLNDTCTLQCHSLEDGIFKSNYMKIGDGCTIGSNAYIHYDVVLGENVILNPDSFLMKGERIKANSTWQGNPASDI